MRISKWNAGFPLDYYASLEDLNQIIRDFFLNTRKVTVNFNFSITDTMLMCEQSSDSVINNLRNTKSAFLSHVYCEAFSFHRITASCISYI